MEHLSHLESENASFKVPEYQSANTPAVEKTEAQDTLGLIKQWQGEWEALLKQPHQSRPVSITFNVLTPFRKIYEKKSDSLGNSVLPSGIIDDIYPYKILHDTTLMIVENAKLIEPNNAGLFLGRVKHLFTNMNTAFMDIDKWWEPETEQIFLYTRNVLHDTLKSYFSKHLNSINEHLRLVRPAEAPDDDKDLLRPAGLGNDPTTDDLVRPSDDPNNISTDTV